MNTVNPDFSRTNKKTNTLLDLIHLWIHTKLDIGNNPNRVFRMVKWIVVKKAQANIHLLTRIKLFGKTIGIRSDVIIKAPVQNSDRGA